MIELNDLYALKPPLLVNLMDYGPGVVDLPNIVLFLLVKFWGKNRFGGVDFQSIHFMGQQSNDRAQI